ncbi:MAG: hypothetical protein ACOYMN_07150, partial [Roseimicrobium sp.]
SVSVSENGTLAFGATPFDAPITKTITISNTQTSAFATGPLVLSNAAAPAGYALTGFPTVALDNGQSATFDVTLTAVNTGVCNASLNFTGNDTFHAATAIGTLNQHTINLTGLVTDTANHWRVQNFGPGATNSGNAADDASPAGDGIANLLKYSLGLNPLTAYPPGTTSAISFDSAGHLTMSVTKNPAAADVSLAIETSSDLRTWSTAEVVIDQNTPTTLQGHDSKTVSAGQRRFIRLRATSSDSQP